MAVTHLAAGTALPATTRCPVHHGPESLCPPLSAHLLCDGVTDGWPCPRPATRVVEFVEELSLSHRGETQLYPLCDSRTCLVSVWAAARWHGGVEASIHARPLTVDDVAVLGYELTVDVLGGVA